MADRHPPSRVYSDKEIGRIIERATELQRAEPGASTSGGMTLAELEEIAAEAGIDVEHVRRAALEVEARPGGPSFWAPILGADVQIRREITIPGEVPEPCFGDLLETIQASVSDHGQPSHVGRTLSWQGGAADNTRRLRVVVSSRDGSTHVRVDENLAQMAGGLFGGIVGGVGCGVGFGFGLPLALTVVQSAALAVAAPLATIALTYLGVRGIFRRVVERRRRVIDHLFDQIVREAQAAIDGTTLRSG